MLPCLHCVLLSSPSALFPLIIIVVGCCAVLLFVAKSLQSVSMYAQCLMLDVDNGIDYLQLG